MENHTNPYGPTQIDPSQFRYVGNFYQGSSQDYYKAYIDDHKDLAEFIGEDWFTQLVFHANHGCASCGTHFAHGAVFEGPDGEFVAIGHTCAAEIFSYNSVYELKRKLAERYKNRREIKAEALDFLARHEGLDEALDTEHYIIEDIKRKLFRYGSLSDAQVALIFKIAKEEAERAAKRAEREAALAETPELVEGRYTIEGTVLSTKWRDTPYGNVYKMTVELPNGNRVWGSVPSMLEEWEYAEPERQLKGLVVRFDAQVQRSEDDEHFGFFKRPTKPVLV